MAYGIIYECINKNCQLKHCISDCRYQRPSYIIPIFPSYNVNNQYDYIL